MTADADWILTRLFKRVVTFVFFPSLFWHEMQNFVVLCRGVLLFISCLFRELMVIVQLSNKFLFDKKCLIGSMTCWLSYVVKSEHNLKQCWKSRGAVIWDFWGAGFLMDVVFFLGFPAHALTWSFLKNSPVMVCSHPLANWITGFCVTCMWVMMLMVHAE